MGDRNTPLELEGVQAFVDECLECGRIGQAGFYIDDFNVWVA